MLLYSSAALLMPVCLLLQTLASPTTGLVTLPKRHNKPTLADPIPPLQDPWYTAPVGFEQTKPGTVLRLREAPGNITSLASNCSAAYNILYRTTNSRYRPDWAVTTVLVPKTKAPALLSYQIPYDSAFLDASPSYSLYSESSLIYWGQISASLSYGWFVNIPDYEGPLASFTAGVQAGHATIDSIRAVLNVNGKLGLSKDARYAMWGYSGGALASEWAAELQVQYAPEMRFSGAALGGLTPNVTSVLLTINKSPGVGLAPSAFLGMSTQYPEVREYIISRMKTSGPYNATAFLAALNYTLDQATLAYAYQDIGDYLIGGIDDLLSNPIPVKMISVDGIMGYHGVPQMPLFVYKAIADEVSVINDTDALVEKYCNVDTNITYRRNTVGNHSTEYINGQPAALAWLTGVLGDTYGQNHSAHNRGVEV